MPLPEKVPDFTREPDLTRVPPPPPAPRGFPRKITIEPVLNGYLVRVGCQQLVFCGKEQLLDALSSYLSNPRAVEGRYREQSIHAELLDGPCQPEPCGQAGQSVSDNVTTPLPPVNRDARR